MFAIPMIACRRLLSPRSRAQQSRIYYAMAKSYNLATDIGLVVADNSFHGQGALHTRCQNGGSELKTPVPVASALDVPTIEHAFRVAVFANALGTSVGILKRELVALTHGAYVHDIGKMFIPKHILNKPAALTRAERSIVETHADIGYQIGCRMRLDEPVLSIVRHHHERWDGGGYPDGLYGEDTPRLARITSVVDTYDALTSPRVYRPALPIEEAVSILREGAGTQFDPLLVDAWIGILLSDELYQSLCGDSMYPRG